MANGAQRRFSDRIKIAAAIMLSVVLIGALAVVWPMLRDEYGASTRPGEVLPGRTNVVESADGHVVVTIPENAVDKPGDLSIQPVQREDQRGWLIELYGAEVTGDVTIAISGLDIQDGEPAPLVRYANDVDGPLRIAPNVTMRDGTVVVTTDHLSSWFVNPWSELLDSTKQWVVNQIDAIFSVASDRAPQCEAEQELLDSGYAVTSDEGRRVYWCFGKEGDELALKVVNARGYGVVAEYTPGVDVLRQDRGGLTDITADLLTPPPSLASNTTTLLPSGDEIVFSVSPSVPLVGVMVQPDPGAYLLSALNFAIDTYSMVMDQVGVTGATAKLLTVLEGQQCLDALSNMATTELGTPQQTQEYLAEALQASFDCVALAAGEVDLGFINQAIVGPVVWLLSGLRTAADGLVAAADIVLDADGYRIEIAHEVASAVTEDVAQRLLIPPGTCGDGISFGWDQYRPIQLVDGEGESFDRELRGAGVLRSMLIGSVDVTDDGIAEAVVSLRCTGSPKANCCAGRLSSMDMIAVFDLSEGSARRVGNTIAPTSVVGPEGYEEPRIFDGGEAYLDGATVVTYQRLVYPEQLDPAQVRDLEGEERYELRDGQWLPSTSF